MPQVKVKTFEEAKAFLALPDNYICYEVRMDKDTSIGDLMTVETYKECVANNTFTDYDGHGLQYDANGKQTSANPRGLVNTRPSAVKKLAQNCAYVLWYNK